MFTQGVGNCSILYTIDTLGGGLGALITLTTDEGKCGGVTLYPYKTLSTIEGKCGGLISHI